MACDPYWNDVTSLVQVVGGALVDLKGGTPVIVGGGTVVGDTFINPATTSASKRSNYLDLQNSIDPNAFSFATNQDFTIELWMSIIAPTTNSYSSLIGSNQELGNTGAWTAQIIQGAGDCSWIGAPSCNLPSSSYPTNDTLFHVSFSRTGASYHGAVNGVLKVTNNSGGAAFGLAQSGVGHLLIGATCLVAASDNSDCHFSLVAARVTKNVDRYPTFPFTPPPAPLPDHSCTITVPDVVGETEADATDAILAAFLTVGAVTYEYSGVVPAGDVISQDPVAGSTAGDGDPVDIVVSLGDTLVSVPDVVGLTQAAATSAIIAATLVLGTVTTAFDPMVPVGLVISSDPVAGASVPASSAVDIVVSLGPESIVPDIVGLTTDDATPLLTTAGLVLGTISTAYSDVVPVSSIISQSPTAGTHVVTGSDVDVVRSLGPSPIEVPNVVTYQLVDAAAILASVGLTVGATSNANSDEIEAGAVISQSPFAGSTVLPGTAVALVISIGPQAVVVPDVVGMTSSDAANTLAAAFLRLGVITVDTSGTFPLGTIAAQDANAGALVPAGTKINLVLSAIAPPFNVNATVISQYAQSPTLVELVESMASYIDPRANLTLFYSYVWNVDTAQGFGLDVWGRIVGIGRLLRITGDDPTFGFWNESVPDDWQPWSQGRFARGGEDGEAVILDDSAYRILILVKALANITATSSASINALLRNLFPGRGKAYVEDLGGMSMRFVFDFKLTPVEYAIVSQSGALPHPAGVSFSVVMPP